MPSKKLPKILEEYCIGCGHCVLACHPKCLKVVDGKSKMVAPEKCDSEGRCVSACPQKAIPNLEEQEY
jgi:ferredoxin